MRGVVADERPRRPPVAHVEHHRVAIERRDAVGDFAHDVGRDRRLAHEQRLVLRGTEEARPVAGRDERVERGGLGAAQHDRDRAVPQLSHAGAPPPGRRRASARRCAVSSPDDNDCGKTPSIVRIHPRPIPAPTASEVAHDVTRPTMAPSTASGAPRCGAPSKRIPTSFRSSGSRRHAIERLFPDEGVLRVRRRPSQGRASSDDRRASCPGPGKMWPFSRRSTSRASRPCGRMSQARPASIRASHKATLRPRGWCSSKDTRPRSRPRSHGTPRRPPSMSACPGYGMAARRAGRRRSASRAGLGHAAPRR